MRKSVFSQEHETFLELLRKTRESAGITQEKLAEELDATQSRFYKKTVESFWPYATTLFDYVKRAMPLDEGK